MPALVFRPENLNHGDILCRPSWPFVSVTQVYTIRLRDTGLYHSSHGHRSVPSVSRTQVCTFRLTDTGLYHPSHGHRSVPSVSRTQVCTIRLWHISLWHPSWPSASGTSISAFCFRDNSLHHSFWLSVSGTSGSTALLGKVTITTITIYFIHPSAKLKLSFDRTTKNIPQQFSVMKHTHIHTLRHTPPFSQSAHTNSKPKITWNNAFSVKPKCKDFEIK